MKSAMPSSSAVALAWPDATAKADRLDASASAARAMRCESAASSLARSIPNSLTYVCFPWRSSLPRGFPSASSVPVTSSMSSTIWNSTPSSAANRRKGAVSDASPIPVNSSTHSTEAPIRRPVLSSCRRRSAVPPAGVCGRTSAYCPPTMPLTPVAAASSAATGVNGMVGGQYADVRPQTPAGGTALRRLHELKTGRLIGASVLCVLLLTGIGDASETAPFRRFAAELGVLFQIVDDILDVTGTDDALGKPRGSDERHGKHTYVSEFGIDRARELAADSHRMARSIPN